MSDQIQALQSELEAARAEIAELRRAVVTMCDTYSANRSEKLKVKAYRLLAAKGPFSLSAVDAEIVRLQNRDRDRDEQLAADLDEALAMFEKEPGLDVAIKAIRYVRDVLDPATAG